MKLSRMDGRHEFLLSTVAERLGISYDEAEEFMLEGDQVCTYSNVRSTLVNVLLSISAELF